MPLGCRPKSTSQKTPAGRPTFRVAVVTDSASALCRHTLGSHSARFFDFPICFWATKAFHKTQLFPPLPRHARPQHARLPTKELHPPYPSKKDTDSIPGTWDPGRFLIFFLSLDLLCFPRPAGTLAHSTQATPWEVVSTAVLSLCESSLTQTRSATADTARSVGPV